MNKHHPPLSADVPEILREELERTPAFTPEMEAELAAANRALEADPKFQAEYLKSLFVEKMLQALEERAETKALVAERLGKSRQYIQKLFNEDRRVNFTIDTLCAIAHALGQRVCLHFCKEGEEAAIISVIKQPRVVPSLRDWSAISLRPPQVDWRMEYRAVKTPESVHEEETHDRANAA